MSDDNDARRLEKALTSAAKVSQEAQVSFATRTRPVRYIPTLVSQADLRKAVGAAGFEVLETGGEAEDAERRRVRTEIAQQRHYLIVGLIFTVPLFLFSMAADLELSRCRWRTPPG